jgi:hypothetical protein
MEQARQQLASCEITRSAHKHNEVRIPRPYSSMTRCWRVHETEETLLHRVPRWTDFSKKPAKGRRSLSLHELPRSRTYFWTTLSLVIQVPP